VLVSQVVAPRRSEIVEMDDPLPGADEVVIDVLASGVCTSDRKPWRELATPESPIRLGHETVGRVSAVGSETSVWHLGDIVTGLGGNGFATKALMDADSILPVPTGLPFEHVIGEPIADLEEAISRTPLHVGDRVAIVGLGFMGLGLLQLARYRIPSLIVAVDPSPAARRRAIELGADEAFHPDELPAAYTGDGGRSGEQRMDVVLEAAGITSALEISSALVRNYGTVCVVGYHHSGTAPMDMSLWYKGATIVNGFSPVRKRTIKAMANGLDLIAHRQFSYAPLITHRFGLEGIDDAFELMESRADDFVKSVILFG
jgi:threonine dehydrogenase-like Zn-dependent dehydrogenase